MLTFADSVFKKLKDKDIEIYLGDTSKERYYADYSLTDKDVLRGKLVDYGFDMLILESNNRLIYINTFAIKTIMELGNMSTADVFYDETKKHKKIK